MRFELVGPMRDETFALYPQARTRAFWMYFGKKSGWFSQQMFSGCAVHVDTALPLSPWTATMLCPIVYINKPNSFSSLWIVNLVLTLPLRSHQRDGTIPERQYPWSGLFRSLEKPVHPG